MFVLRKGSVQLPVSGTVVFTVKSFFVQRKLSQKAKEFDKV